MNIFNVDIYGYVYIAIVTPDWAKEETKTECTDSCKENNKQTKDEFPFSATMSIENFQLFLEKNSDKIKEDVDYIKNMRDKRRMTLLHCACINDCDDLIEPLISKYHINVNEIDIDGYSALFYSVNQWNEDCVKKLLIFKPRLDLITKDAVIHATGFPIYICGGKTIFHQSAEINSIQCCKLILNYIKQYHSQEMISILYKKDFNGFTAMDIAQMQNKPEILNMLNQFIYDNNSNDNNDEEKSKVYDEQKRKSMKREYYLKIRERIKENEEKQDKSEQLNIAKHYKPKYPKLFFQNDEFFPIQLLDPTLLRLINELKDFTEIEDKQKIIKKYSCDPINFLEKPLDGIWVFRVFSNVLCNKLLLESENYIQQSLFSNNSGLLPIKRPNSMNSYGLVLNTIGMKKSWTYFIKQIIKPLSDLLLYHYLTNNNKEYLFTNHHTFIIRYKQGEDINLDTHIDASKVTLNICIGNQKEGFEGAFVYFHGLESGENNKQLYQTPHPDDNCKHCLYKLFHQIGFGVLHVGNYIHGTTTLQRGERSNVVIWCKE